MEPVLCCCRGTTVKTVLCDVTLLFFLEVQKKHDKQGGEPTKRLSSSKDKEMVKGLKCPKVSF